jgi:hypothetical protein
MIFPYNLIQILCMSQLKLYSILGNLSYQWQEISDECFFKKLKK